MKSIIKAAAYLRVSTTSQDYELQRVEIQRYLTARNVDQITWYEEKLSGTTSKRPQFQQLMKDARAMKFNAVVVFKLDRFSRSLKDLVFHLNELTELDVAFISIRDNLDFSTSAGRMMFHLLASFCEFEHTLILERIQAGLANAKRNGVKLGRPKKVIDSRVISLRNEGLSFSEIGKRLGLSKSCVHKTHMKNIASTQL